MFDNFAKDINHTHGHGCGCSHESDDVDDTVVIHNAQDFEGMRKAGKLASQVLDFITPHVIVGRTTDELNTLCHDFIIEAGAIPAPLGYRGFPKSICTSVNHVVCHGIPGPKKLSKGDSLNIDVTVIQDGWHGDSSRMFSVGPVSKLVDRLSNVTYEAMMRGIEVVKPGAHTSDIGRVIQSYVEKHGYSVVKDFTGHGIGRTFHAGPMILHYYAPDYGVEIKEGMFFTVEPMVNAGKPHTKVLADGWTAVTRDASLSAQWEHTIGVTASGFEIFT